MARNYAALPHEYLQEMAELSDAEFGRLCRILLEYSSGLPVSQVKGNERFYLTRVQTQEERFQSSYKEQSEKKASAGRKGAEARWQTMANDGSAILPLAQDGTPMASGGKNGNTKTDTKTKTKTKTDTKTNVIPSDDGKDSLRTASTAVADYLDRVNPSASPRSLEELVAFEKAMGGAVCWRAIDIALDSRKATWPYIRAILQRWKESGVRCLADVEALEARHMKSKLGGSGGNPRSPGAAERKAMADMDQILKKGAEGGPST